METKSYQSSRTDDDDKFLTIHIDEHLEKTKIGHKGRLANIHTWWGRRTHVMARVSTYMAITDEQHLDVDFLAALGAENPHDDVLMKAQRDVRDSAWKWRLSDDYAEGIVDSKIGEPAAPPLPKILDPFAGDGVLPLEASKLGCDSYAGDPNPIAHRILQGTIWYPSRLIDAEDASSDNDARPVWHGLAAEVRTIAKEVERRALQRLVDLFPFDPETGYPIDRYFWFVFDQCSNPECGVAYPMQKSLELTHRPKVLSAIFEWNEDRLTIKLIDGETKEKSSFRSVCPKCGSDSELSSAKNNKTAPRLLLVRHATSRPNLFAAVGSEIQNHHTPWTTTHANRLTHLLDKPGSKSLLADLTSAFQNLTKYGITTFKDIYLPRQLLVALEYVDAIQEVISELEGQRGTSEHSEAFKTYFGFFLAYLVERNSKLCSWNSQRNDSCKAFERVSATYPKVFVERSPYGLLDEWLDRVIPAIEAAGKVNSATNVYTSNASRLPFDADFFDGIVTSPPYNYEIKYAEFAEYFWVWERMLLPEEITVSGTMVSSKQIDANEIKSSDKYEKLILLFLKDAYRVLKPGRKLCLIINTKSNTHFQSSYMDFSQQAGFDLSDIKRVPTEFAGDQTHFTYLVTFRKPRNLSVRTPLTTVEAVTLFNAADTGKPILYSGLAKLIVNELEDQDLKKILPSGGKGNIDEQVQEALYDNDPRELLEKLFSQKELRKIAEQLTINSESKSLITPIETILSNFGFKIHYASDKYEGVTQVLNILKRMQSKIRHAKSKEDVKGPFSEGCSSVERLLFLSVRGWATQIFCTNRDATLITILKDADQNKSWDLKRLSFGDILVLFRDLPDTIASSLKAEIIERKFGRQHIYLAKNKKTKYYERLKQLLAHRNKLSHDSDGNWTNNQLNETINELCSALNSVEKLLHELVAEHAIPKIVEPILEKCDKWGRKSFTLLADDGIEFDVRSSSGLTLGKCYLYYGTEVNPRPVDPLMVSVDEVDYMP